VDRAKTSRRGIGKIGAALVVVVMAAMVVGVGGFFASQGPPEKLSAQQIISSELASSSASQYSSASSTTQTTCSAGATINVTAGSSSPPCGCALVDSNSNGSLYLSPNPKVGDNVCILATLSGSSEVFLKITNSTGSLMFSDQCAASGAGPSNGDTCLSLWNTATPDPHGNAIEPGTYRLVATGSSAAVQLEVNFTLS
jgi:hypothetical protein